ncbi:uncharacterized protein LOC120348319 [Styela clava]
MDICFMYLTAISLLLIMDMTEAVPCGDPGRIIHGNAKFLKNGMLVQFFCDPGYQTMGPPLLSCSRGNWRGKKPVCVAPGCPPYVQPLNSMKYEKMKGAVVRYQCQSGFRTIGEDVIYCDGFHWNAPPPICQNTSPTTTKIVPTNPPQRIEENRNISTQINSTAKSSNSKPELVDRQYVENVKMQKPIFVGPSDKPPVFHSEFLKKLGSSGVLPLYKGRGSEEDDEVTDRTEDVSSRITQERQMPPLSIPDSQKMAPTSPQVSYNSYVSQRRPFEHSQGSYRNSYEYRNRYMLPIMSPAGQSPRYRPMTHYGGPQYYRPRYVPMQTRTSIRPILLNREEQGTLKTPKLNLQSGITRESEDEEGKSQTHPPELIPNSRTLDSIYGNVVRSVPTVIEARRDEVLHRFEDNNGGGLTREATQGSDNGVLVPGIMQIPDDLASDEEPQTSTEIKNCPPPRRLFRGYYTTQPKPRDYEGDDYQYFVEYHCLVRLKLVGGDRNIYCMRNGKWKGKLPRCEKDVKCPPGFKEDSSGRCSDIDECLVDNGGCPQSCVNIPGRFFCTCEEGYFRSTDGTTCLDIDECNAPRKKICNHECYNTPGSFYCSCREGYSLMKHDNRTCLDINECLISSPCQQLCKNTFGSFQCSCNPDYRLNEDGLTCSGLCQPGYVSQLDTDSGEEICVDNNECEDNEGLGACQHMCTNTDGSFFCSCSPGYTLQDDMLTCEDTDECLTSSPCQHLCQNTPGSFRCACNVNYRLNAEGLTCSEVCQPGYVMSVIEETGEKTCVDENECSEHGGLGNCQQICTNTDGSYFCSCSLGYKLNEDMQTCSDQDECESSPCTYGCINNDGSYTCTCPEDRVLSPDGFSCSGCKENTYMDGNGCLPCPQNSVTKKAGGADKSHCLCLPGYRGSPELNIACTDIDECEDANYGCSHNCANTPGSVSCECPDGFRLGPDGRKCQDIDECSLYRGACGRGGLCSNTEGGYNCTCTRGYKMESRNSNVCIDIDECQTNNGGCQVHCHNLRPGYRCSCDNDWRLNRDGRSCSPLIGACPKLEPLSNGRVLPEAPCVHHGTVTRGRFCLYACNSGYKMVGVNRRRCVDSGWTGKPPTCSPAGWCPPMAIPDGVKVIPPACAQNSSMPWMMCVFSCKVSTHVMKGGRVIRCNINHRWDHEPPTCVARNLTASSDNPQIQCPRDIDVELAPGESSAKVTLPKPVTNMEITEQRNDGSESRDIFPAGTTSVRFTAYTNDKIRQASCVMRVRVRDRQAPIIQQCPRSISIESMEKFPQISWKRPVFRDNVAVELVKESRFPRGNITWGTYSVSYTASDAAGNMAECAFTVSIRRPKSLQQAGAISCGRPTGPKNGQARCQTWARGVYCIPRCNPRYAFQRRPPTFVCDNDGVWTPGNVIPDCIDVRSIGENIRNLVTTPTLSTTTTTTTEPSPTPMEITLIYSARTSSSPTTVAMQSLTSAMYSETGVPTLATEIPEIKFLERPKFFLVPTEPTTRIETVSQHLPSPITPVYITNAVVHYRASQPRLIKLAPETNDCPRGQVPEQDSEGRGKCVECPRGTYRPRIKSAVKCLSCSPGFYQDKTGMGYCSRCPNYIPHVHTSAIRGNTKLIGLKSVDDCEMIHRRIQTRSSDIAVRRALARRRRLLRH